MDCRGVLVLVVVWMAVAVAQPQDRRPKLENRTYVVTSILTSPFLETVLPPADGPAPTGNDRYRGYIPDLLEMIAQKTGIKYVIRLVKDGRYGAFQNGEWTGMIGEVLRGEADFAAAPLTVTSRRGRVIDFSRPFMNSGIAMVMSKRVVFGTPYVRGLFDGWLIVFSSEIWLVLAALAVLIWLCLVLLRRFHPDEKAEDEKMTFLKAVQTETKGLFSKNPRASGARRVFVYACYVFWGMIMLLYICQLVWFRSAENPGAPFVASVKDVASQSRIQFGAVRGGSTYNFFQSSRVPLYKKIWNMMSTRPGSFVTTTEEGIQRARMSAYAFLNDEVSYSIDRKPCDLVRVGPRLNSVAYSFAMKINSSLQVYIDLAILELKEDGDLHMLEKKWWLDRGECAKPLSVSGPSRGSAKGDKFIITQATLRRISLPILIIVIAMIVALLMTLFKIFGSTLFGNFGKKTENANESQHPLNDEDKADGKVNDMSPETLEIQA